MKSTVFRHDSLSRHVRLAGRISSALLLLLVFLSAGCNRDPKKFLAKGNASYDQGKYSEALIYYGRAIQLDPRYAEAHFKLSQTQLKLMSWSAAFAELQRTVELQPDNWEAQRELGRLQLAGGQKQEAKDRALLILKSNPGNVEAQLLLSDADATLGNQKEALTEARETVEMAPNNATAFENLGLLQQRTGAFREAEANAPLSSRSSLRP